MSLYTKISLAILLSLVMLFLAEVFQIRSVVEHYEPALQENYALKADSAERAVKRRINQMETAATVLSRSVEISMALQRADNEVLFDISHEFVGPIDDVVFADVNGIVISRAADEFRFGDDIATADYFKTALAGGRFSGITVVDGNISIVCANPIKKYDDMVIGVIFVCVNVTPDLLKSFVFDESMFIEFRYDGVQIKNAEAPREIIRSKLFAHVFGDASQDRSQLYLHFIADEHFHRLMSLEKVIYASSVLIVLTALLLMGFILRRQLKPVSTIVEDILKYSGKEIAADTFKERLVATREGYGAGGEKIATALIQMLDVTTENMRQIEAANRDLSDTVQKLEKSITEIKTLQGLLPICASCKKIRDDKGYWNQLESYIEDHSEAAFSHSICPDCMKALYPEYEPSNRKPPHSRH